MKKSELKAIVKECLLEIFGEVLLNENSQRQVLASRAPTRNISVKKSLNSLMNNPVPTRSRRVATAVPIAGQQNRVRPPTMEEMIFSARETMENQNAGGEMSARPMEMMSMVDVGGAQMSMQENFGGYGGAYGNAPIPQLSNGSIGAASIGSGLDIDGDSHWATVAFFDEQ